MGSPRPSSGTARTRSGGARSAPASTASTTRSTTARRSDRSGPAAAPLTLAIAGVLFAFAIFQALDASLLDALRRDPDGLRDGELWRLFTPLLVQEAGPVSQLFLLIPLLVAGRALERGTGGRWLLAAFAAGAVAGEAAGYAWHPHGAGASVAIAGVVAATLLAAARNPDALGVDPDGRTPIRVLAAIAVAGGVVLTAAADNHGPALIAGAVLGAAIPL